MRIVRYDAGAGPRYGELAHGTVHEWHEGLFGARQRSGRTHAAETVRTLPPVVPSKFILASLNYQEVVTQLGYPRPDRTACCSRLAHVIPAGGREGDGEWISG